MGEAKTARMDDDAVPVRAQVRSLALDASEALSALSDKASPQPPGRVY